MESYYDRYIQYILRSNDYIINNKPTKVIFKDLSLDKFIIEKIETSEINVNKNLERRRLLINTKKKLDFTVINGRDIPKKM